MNHRWLKFVVTVWVLTAGCRPGVGSDDGAEASTDSDDGDACATGAQECATTQPIVRLSNFRHSCAVAEDGEIRCWGPGYAGRLGHGLNDDVTIGVDQPVWWYGALDLPPVSQVSSSEAYTCASLVDGGVLCWGVPFFDEPESPGCAADGQLLLESEDVAVLAAGIEHTCALLGTGQIWCWDRYEAPYEAPSLATVVDIDVGQVHACALTNEGTVHCFGSAGEGALGYGDGLDRGQLPKILLPDEFPPAVELGEPATDVCAGAFFSCAVLQSGDVRCWGTNYAGQLGWFGTGDLIDPWGEPVGDDELPTAVPPVDLGATATRVFCGAEHACALTDTGALRCWGYRSTGALGYTEPAPEDATPAEMGDVPLNGASVDAALGTSSTCAIMEGGGVRCFGMKPQLGYQDVDNQVDASEVPGDVPIFCGQ